METFSLQLLRKFYRPWFVLKELGLCKQVYCFVLARHDLEGFGVCPRRMCGLPFSAHSQQSFRSRILPNCNSTLVLLFNLKCDSNCAIAAPIYSGDFAHTCTQYDEALGMGFATAQLHSGHKTEVLSTCFSTHKCRAAYIYFLPLYPRATRSHLHIHDDAHMNEVLTAGRQCWLGLGRYRRWWGARPAHLHDYFVSGLF